MLAKQLHRARLRAFLTHLLRKGHARADGEAIKAVEHAVTVKIHFAAVARFEESELAQFIQPHDGSDWLAFMDLHLTLQPAGLILQLTARPLECVIDRECQVGMSLVRLRGSSNIDLAAIGEREPDVDLIEPPGPVMAAGPLEHDPTGSHSIVTALQVFYVLDDGIPEFRGPIHALKIDFDRCFHIFKMNPSKSSDVDASQAASQNCFTGMLPVPIMSFGAAIECDVFWELIYVNDHDVNLRLMKQKRASISFFQFGNPHIC